MRTGASWGNWDILFRGGRKRKLASGPESLPLTSRETELLIRQGDANNEGKEERSLRGWSRKA